MRTVGGDQHAVLAVAVGDVGGKVCGWLLGAAIGDEIEPEVQPSAAHIADGDVSLGRLPEWVSAAAAQQDNFFPRGLWHRGAQAREWPAEATSHQLARIRRVAELPGQMLMPQIVQMNGVIADNRGTGGTCFGDSGGPAYLNDYIVTVTSYGYTDNCRYLGGYQRLDIEAVQDWLLPIMAANP